MAITRDVLGRITIDAVTTLGSGVNGSVRRIEYAYDGQGNVYLITSYDAATGGNIVNQVQREFNGLGQLITEYQEHGGAVNTSTSPKVQYAFSEMSGGANHSRLNTITYPSGYVLTHNYSAGLNDSISRLSSLSDSTGTVESYDYLGWSIVVRRGHSQPGVDLTYIKQSGESNGDAGDQYTGLDRFTRVSDQRWIKTSSGTATDRFHYGYDRDSNRLYRDNLVNTAFGEIYAYDGLNQITSFDRGTLNGTKTGLTGSASRAQDFDFDALGNWESLTNDGGSPETRTHNKQNEVTQVGSNTLTFDANGNTTTDETGKQFVYDAWNRLVVVKNSGGTTLKTFAYDGMGRRVSETASGTTTDLFYSDAWQVLEEKVGSNTKKRYVWSPVYVDALILRDRDTDANGTLDERLWVQQDANWNITALVDGSGIVVERYAYDVFGLRTVYDASWNVRTGGSSYDFHHGFQGLWYDPTAELNFTFTRPYSPSQGRFTGPDWIRFDGGDVNLYRFVGNGPTNLVDPSGLQPPNRPNGAVSGGRLPVGPDDTVIPFPASAEPGVIVVSGGRWYVYHGVTMDMIDRQPRPPRPGVTLAVICPSPGEVVPIKPNSTNVILNNGKIGIVNYINGNLATWTPDRIEGPTVATLAAPIPTNPVTGPVIGPSGSGGSTGGFVGPVAGPIGGGSTVGPVAGGPVAGPVIGGGVGGPVVGGNSMGGGVTRPPGQQTYQQSYEVSNWWHYFDNINEVGPPFSPYPLPPGSHPGVPGPTIGPLGAEIPNPNGGFQLFYIPLPIPAPPSRPVPRPR